MATHSARRREERCATTEAVEDYAKAIYALERRDGGAVTTTALAERLAVTAGSASAMVKRLHGLGLVSHVPYRGVNLAEAGREVALEILRHHRLLERYLSEELGVPWDRVHAEAEILEHVLSEELEERIAAKLGHPTHDPHGDPIPTLKGEIDEGETRSLADLRPGDRGIFVRVSDAEPEMLRYLAGRELQPGMELEVRAQEPFGGALIVVVGSREHQLGPQLASAMRVASAPATSPRRSRP